MKLIRIAAAGVLAALALAGCAGNPMASSGAGASGESIVVGSANFPESELLADIYAEALKAKGVAVTTKLNIASRETYVPALKSGEINLIPEYTGNFAKYLNKDADVADEAKALAALRAALPDTLVALEPAKAQDKDAVVVTAATASKYSLTSIADLAPVAGQLVLGGPPEWPTRANGVPGLASVYGVTFKEFKPLDVAGPLSVQALKNDQVQATNLFTTDPSIKANGFVVLDDPKNLFGAQNVIPVITKAKASDTVKGALNAVSAKLDTDTLAGLVTKVVVDKKDASAVASEWLKAQGLA
ncbi:ABC transporter substrate-binding protein [Propioniciclava tarda]|mgnify:CR=1 FL=1|uniref:ABC transporter substrate-binding protein n=1 Tax=Propioniciclava tarda TaxID=433330 RepID=A0A4Q9KIP5_PROTD|nr:ABC transporter substrate-binding protein [Propioniciclava tarda]TBT94292.1 ABC transporter substrate-binding protein [Propioniciclava tarda]SMO73907.1 osmoprotectant transport system substrate-binding protein [Propioniciclava tarda]HQA15287.1 ABC transporter substrate-binding protein [Ornithinibacter sp.]HQD69566.1 ABC transporter substrate-binding protein [Ornithinibacter sp.]